MADYIGTAGRDRIRATNSDDYIDVSQGGNDTVTALRGDEIIYFGAAYTVRDLVRGGGGFDKVILDGDYSAGIEVTADNLSGIETLELRGGSYRITGVLGFTGPFGPALVDASALDEGQSLDLDVAAAAGLRVVGSGGGDVVRGASDGTASEMNGLAGDDVLIGNGASRMAGAEGADRIFMNGDADVAIYYGDFVQSARGAVDTIENFAASGGRIQISLDSDTTTPEREYDYHLGRTEERAGDIVSRYDAARDRTIVRVFTDGDDQADLVLHLSGQVALTPDDFVFGPG